MEKQLNIFELEIGKTYKLVDYDYNYNNTKSAIEYLMSTLSFRKCTKNEFTAREHYIHYTNSFAYILEKLSILKKPKLKHFTITVTNIRDYILVDFVYLSLGSRRYDKNEDNYHGINVYKLQIADTIISANKKIRAPQSLAYVIETYIKLTEREKIVKMFNDMYANSNKFNTIDFHKTLYKKY